MNTDLAPFIKAMSSMETTIANQTKVLDRLPCVSHGEDIASLQADVATLKSRPQNGNTTLMRQLFTPKMVLAFFGGISILISAITGIFVTLHKQGLLS